MHELHLEIGSNVWKIPSSIVLHFVGIRGRWCQKAIKVHITLGDEFKSPKYDEKAVVDALLELAYYYVLNLNQSRLFRALLVVSTCGGDDPMSYVKLFMSQVAQKSLGGNHSQVPTKTVGPVSQETFEDLSTLEAILSILLVTYNQQQADRSRLVCEAAHLVKKASAEHLRKLQKANEKIIKLQNLLRMKVDENILAFRKLEKQRKKKAQGPRKPVWKG